MTHSVLFLIVYNKLSKTSYISSQQANSVIPYASADAKMHPDRGALATVAQWYCGYTYVSSSRSRRIVRSIVWEVIFSPHQNRISEGALVSPNPWMIAFKAIATNIHSVVNCSNVDF